MSISWSVRKLKLKELSSAKYNPRKLTTSQHDQLTTSIKKFGYAEPIVVNKNNVIIGGHQRVNILKEQNINEIDVMAPDRLLTDKEEKELNLRLNKNTGEWDFDLLTSNFESELLLDVGFSESEFLLDQKEDDLDLVKEKEISSIYQVLVECESEKEQEEAFGVLKRNNFNCKVITL